MLDALNIHCEHRSINPGEFLTVLEQIEEVMKPDPPMATPTIFYENESNAVSSIESNASIPSYSSPNISTHSLSIKTEPFGYSNEAQLSATTFRSSQSSIGQRVISPVTEPVTHVQADAAQQFASYLEQQQAAALAQQFAAYMQQQQQAAFAQSVASYMQQQPQQQQEFALPPPFGFNRPPQQATFPPQFGGTRAPHEAAYRSHCAAPVAQQQAACSPKFASLLRPQHAAFQSQFAAPVPQPHGAFQSQFGAPVRVPTEVPFLSGAPNDSQLLFPMCSSWPPFGSPMSQPIGEWRPPYQAPMPQPIGEWRPPYQVLMPQPVASSCPTIWTPQLIGGSASQRHGTSSDSGCTSRSMCSKSTHSDSTMSNITGARGSIPQDIMTSLNEGTQLLLSLQEPHGNAENRGSNFSMYLTDVLLDRRPCKLIPLMREVLSRCGSTPNDQPQLRKAKCGNKLEHLVFICLLASELEHLWATTCYWAHDESLDNSMLTTVYIHPEFYKRSIDINANPKLKILPRKFIRVLFIL